MGLGWDVLQSWNPEADSGADFRLGTDRPASQRPGLRHAGRGGERICGDERRTRRRADRAGVSARRHDLGAVCRQRRDVRALPPRRARRAGSGDRRRAVRIAVLAARSAGRRSTRRSAGCASATAAVRRTPARAAAIRRATAATSRSADRRRRWRSGSCRPTGSVICSRIPRFADERGPRRSTRTSSTPRSPRRSRRARSRRTCASSTSHALTAVAVQTVADIERDPHWQARHLLRRCAERHTARCGCTTSCRACPRRPGRSRGRAARSVNTTTTCSDRARPELRRADAAAARPA